VAVADCAATCSSHMLLQAHDWCLQILIGVSVLRAFASSSALPEQLAWLSGGASLGLIVVTIFTSSLVDIPATASSLRQQIQSARARLSPS
jgi:hypothetical protein